MYVLLTVGFRKWNSMKFKVYTVSWYLFTNNVYCSFQCFNHYYIHLFILLQVLVNTVVTQINKYSDNVMLNENNLKCFKVSRSCFYSRSLSFFMFSTFEMISIPYLFVGTRLLSRVRVGPFVRVKLQLWVLF